jgi:hypothetical protein
MSELPKLNPVKIVKFTGDRKSGVTDTGKTVYRQEKLWMGKEYGFVATAQFGSHFIFHDPDFNQQTGEWPRGKKFMGRWSPLCSCGSPAAIYGFRAYQQFSSPEKNSSHPGQMLLCKSVVDFGHHMDGSHD